MAVVNIRPENLMPIRLAGGRTEFVSMSDSYSIKLEGLSIDECRAIGELLVNIGSIGSLKDMTDQQPGEPPLPADFQRRLEID